MVKEVHNTGTHDFDAVKSDELFTEDREPSAVLKTADDGDYVVVGDDDRLIKTADGLEAIKYVFNNLSGGLFLIKDSVEVDISNINDFMRVNADGNQVFKWSNPIDVKCSSNAWVKLVGSPPSEEGFSVFVPSDVDDVSLDINFDTNASNLDYSSGTWNDSSIYLIGAIGLGDNDEPVNNASVSCRVKNFNINEQSGTDNLAGLGFNNGLQGRNFNLVDSHFERGDTAVWLTTEFDSTPNEGNVSDLNIEDCGRGSVNASALAFNVEAGNDYNINNVIVDSAKGTGFNIFDVGSVSGDTARLNISNLIVIDADAKGLFLGGSNEVSEVLLNNVVVKNCGGNNIQLANCKNIVLNNIYSTSSATQGIDIYGDNIQLSNGIFTYNGSNGVRVDSSAGEVIFSDVDSSFNDYYGIATGSNDYIVINGLRAFNNNQSDSFYRGVQIGSDDAVISGFIVGDDQGTLTQNTAFRPTGDNITIENGKITSNQSIDDQGTNTELNNITNYKTADQGVETQSGDGSVKIFTISHSLVKAPSNAQVIPASEDASTDFYVSDKTSSNIEITYAQAPASGTDNLSWEWEAEV